MRRLQWGRIDTDVARHAKAHMERVWTRAGIGIALLGIPFSLGLSYVVTSHVGLRDIVPPLLVAAMSYFTVASPGLTKADLLNAPSLTGFKVRQIASNPDDLPTDPPLSTEDLQAVHDSAMEDLRHRAAFLPLAVFGIMYGLWNLDIRGAFGALFAAACLLSMWLPRLTKVPHG